MKILIYTNVYWPSTGGIETVMRLLAYGFVAQGHQVTLATKTDGPEHDNGIKILRRAKLKQLFDAARSSDIILQANISLPATWLLLLTLKRIFVIHHTWYTSPGGLKSALKLATTFFTSNISVSDIIRKHIPAGGYTIPNPYDDTLFQVGITPRAREILFVGRLVPDKGVEILLRALAYLVQNNQPLRLTVAGDGPDRRSLEVLAHNLGISSSVVFKGTLEGYALAELYRTHQVLVVPSVWSEPFGVVALEGYACGCQVIVAKSGALPAVVGNYGTVYFPNTPETLAQTLLKTLDRVPDEIDRTYLEQFSQGHISARYLQVMERVR